MLNINFIIFLKMSLTYLLFLKKILFFLADFLMCAATILKSLLDDGFIVALFSTPSITDIA